MGLLTDLISKVGLDTKELEKDLDRASQLLERKGRRMSLVGNDLMQNVSLPILALGGFAVKSAADIERLELALKNTMGEGYVEELEKLKEIAKDPGVGFEQAIRGSVALQAVGESAETARMMMQEWGNAVAAAGGTAAQLDLVVTQLQQALGKQGALLREDWKFIVQQAPQAQKAMLDLYGTNSLEELSKRGLTAREVLMSITEKLKDLGRVEGGIANFFKIFRDEINQSLAPMGKLIFESIGLREMMKDIVSGVVTATKAFSNLHPMVQRGTMIFAAMLAGIGPLVRTLGSMNLVYAKLGQGIGGAIISMKKWQDSVRGARQGLEAGASTMNVMAAAMDTLQKRAILAANALGIVGLAATTAFGVEKVRGAIGRWAGEMNARNPNSGLGKILNFAGVYGTLGQSAANGWVEGYVAEMKRQQDALAEAMKVPANLVGGDPFANMQVSRPGQEIYTEAELARIAEIEKERRETLEKINKELQTQLRYLTEQEKILGKPDNVARSRAIWTAIEKNIKELGMSAGSAPVQKLVGDLRDLRGELKTISDLLPSLNLPAALAPTGGIPSAAANNLLDIQKQQKLWNEQTQYYRGLGMAKSLSTGYAEGLISFNEASMILIRKYGLGMGQELIKSLDNGMVLQGQQLLDSMSDLMNNLKITLSTGFSEAIGSIVGGKNPLKAFAEGLILPLTDMMKQFGELLIAAGTAREAFSKLAITGIGAIVAGSALIATSAAVKAFMQNRLTSLAEGGIATGPVPALVGDNPRSPELITPLHKLPGLLREVMGPGWGGGPTIRILGELKVDGNKLTYFIDEQVDMRKSLSMY